jgi:dUTP pyrophosphatase
MSLQVIIARLDPRAEIPSKAYADDAGFDLVCTEGAQIDPGAVVDVKTGIAIAMPPGWWGRIIGRSSTLRKHGLIVNEGVIDAGFRGELFTGVFNPTDEYKVIQRGERLAQLLFLPVPDVHWSERAELPPSERGENGFGSSGS